MKTSHFIRAISAMFTLPARSSLAVNATTMAPPADQVINLLPTAAHAANVLVTRTGASAGYYVVCGANDEPCGFVESPVLTADLGRAQAVMLLGLFRRPTNLTASETLAAPGTLIYTAADGQIQNEPASAGVYYNIGRTIGPIASGLVGACETWQPRKVTVLAAPTAVSTTNASDLATAIALANALKADQVALRTALAHGGTIVQL